MGILFSLISVLTFFGRRTLVAKLLLILLFWAFALLTGLSVSVVRSALMLSIATIFSLREGHISSVNVLCFSALVILLFNPYALYDVGFQLSFLSVFAILLLMPLFDALWPPHFQNSHRCLQTLWRLVSVSMAAQIGTAPLIAFYFGQLPVYFVLSNLIVIPCSYVVLWLCLCYLVFPFPLIGQILLGTIKAMNNLLTALSGWPCASISGFHPSVLQTMMVYIIIIAIYLVIVKLRNIRVQL
jgi:competence protein ComEC